MTNKKTEFYNRFKKLNNRSGPLVVLFLLLLAVPLLTSALQRELSDDILREGIVTIRGEEVFRVNLNSQTPHQEVIFHPSSDQFAVIEVNGPRLRIKEDSTDSKFAVNKGWIEYPGETTVSLEHGLLIHILSIDSEQDEYYHNQKKPSYPF